MDGGGSSSGGAKEPKSKGNPRKAKQILNLRRRVFLSLTRLKKLYKTEQAREKAREEKRLAKEARELEEQLAEEAREKARKEERLAKEARELEEWKETIRKCAAITYEMWAQRAEEEEDPNDTESTKEFMRRICEGEITKETFIQGVLKASVEGEVVEEDDDFEEWPPSPSNSP